MSTKYKATTTEDAYFITMSTMGWVDIFTRLNQKPQLARASRSSTFSRVCKYKLQ
ncbi:hypothetical protein [Flavobacterium xueshanense]|uniref:Uncharacterized protein n=1 Tax=Flavobacterium xueshanense TaxID=935223 RepID=A0A1I2GJZ4_9FLAO|nr:hypothetical protein SAMN04488131_11095 [Flavobacterium xueshanense]